MCIRDSEEWSELSNAYLADICNVSIELVRRVRKSMGLDSPGLVMGKDGKQYPTGVEREARGKGESERDELPGSGGEDGGGGGGKPSKKNSNYNDAAGGGSNTELENEAREMIRKGEMDPRELKTLRTALPTDYAIAAINLMDNMDREDRRYMEALDRLERWIAKRKSEMSSGG